MKKNIDIIFLTENESSCFEYDWIKYLLKDNFFVNYFYINPHKLIEFANQELGDNLKIIVISDNDNFCKSKLKQIKNKFDYGIIHLSDEWFLSNYSLLYDGALFVFRNYLNPSLVEKDNIFHFPLGPRFYDFNLSKTKKIQSKSKLIFFKGEIKGERKKMINTFKKNSIDIFKGSNKRLSYEDYLKELRSCVFSLSPNGNTTPETLRVYECIENDVIPICSSLKALNYFTLLFSKPPPFLFFKSWENASRYFKTNDNFIMDKKSILEINDWWDNEKLYFKNNFNNVIHDFSSHNKDKIKLPFFKSIHIRIKSIFWLLYLQDSNSLISRFKNLFNTNLIIRILKRMFLG